MIDVIAQHTQLHPIAVQVALVCLYTLAAVGVVLAQISPRQRTMQRRMARWQALALQRFDGE